MKNILIAGISGFVENNIVNYFYTYAEYKIFGLDIVFPDIVGVEKICFSDDLEFIKDMDVVIHLAGKAHDLKNTID